MNTTARKKILRIILLLFFSLSFSQKITSDSLRAEFTYLLEYKPNLLAKDYIEKELFTLQISDNRSFFISENRLKFDSAFSTEYNKRNSTIDLSRIPASKSNFLIIQTNNNISFYETIGMTLFSYNDKIINDWKLINETKAINSFVCKKAEVHFRGRDWIAWYSTEIPLPYGPYKFSGLPGLIVKITDKTGDYNFEIVKSVSNSQLIGRLVKVNKARYNNPKLITKNELTEARNNFRVNARQQLENMGTVFTENQKENLRDRQNRIENERKTRNPIELED